jgi:hypothetical protein
MRSEEAVKFARITLVALALAFSALASANPVSASSRPNISSVAVLSSSDSLGVRLPPGVRFTAAQDLFTTSGVVYVIVIGGDFTTHGWEGKKMTGTGPEPLASHYTIASPRNGAIDAYFTLNAAPAQAPRLTVHGPRVVGRFPD